MTTLILSFVLLALIMAGMAIGVILGGKPIKGSCGGVGAALGEKDYKCSLCGDDPSKCEEQSSKTGNSALAVDVSKQTKEGKNG